MTIYTMLHRKYFYTQFRLSSCLQITLIMYYAYYNDVTIYIFSLSNLMNNSNLIGKMFNDPRGRQWNFIKQYKHLTQRVWSLYKLLYNGLHILIVVSFSKLYKSHFNLLLMIPPEGSIEFRNVTNDRLVA